MADRGPATCEEIEQTGRTRQVARREMVLRMAALEVLFPRSPDMVF
jgi:hypothetical protein